MDMNAVAGAEVRGVNSPELQTPLAWSAWSRLQSSFSLALTPQEPGVFALAEEIVTEGGNTLLGRRRMLALFQVSAADNLARSLDRLFASPLRKRLEAGQCFVRYALIDDYSRRDAVCAAMQNWLAASSEAASGVIGVAEPRASAPAGSAGQGQAAANGKGIGPPPQLPAGF